MGFDNNFITASDLTEKAEKNILKAAHDVAYCLHSLMPPLGLCLV